MKTKEVLLEKKENTESNYKALFHGGWKQHEYETESHRQQSVYNQSNPRPKKLRDKECFPKSVSVIVTIIEDPPIPFEP